MGSKKSILKKIWIVSVQIVIALTVDELKKIIFVQKIKNSTSKQWKLSLWTKCLKYRAEPYIAKSGKAIARYNLKNRLIVDVEDTEDLC